MRDPFPSDDVGGRVGMKSRRTQGGRDNQSEEAEKKKGMKKTPLTSLEPGELTEGSTAAAVDDFVYDDSLEDIAMSPENGIRERVHTLRDAIGKAEKTVLLSWKNREAIEAPTRMTKHQKDKMLANLREKKRRVDELLRNTEMSGADIRRELDRIGEDVTPISAENMNMHPAYLNQKPKKVKPGKNTAKTDIPIEPVGMGVQGQKEADTEIAVAVSGGSKGPREGGTEQIIDQEAILRKVEQAIGEENERRVGDQSEKINALEEAGDAHGLKLLRQEIREGKSWRPTYLGHIAEKEGYELNELPGDRKESLRVFMEDAAKQGREQLREKIDAAIGRIKAKEVGSVSPEGAAEPVGEPSLSMGVPTEPVEAVAPPVADVVKPVEADPVAVAEEGKSDIQDTEWIDSLKRRVSGQPDIDNKTLEAEWNEKTRPIDPKIFHNRRSEKGSASVENAERIAEQERRAERIAFLRETIGAKERERLALAEEVTALEAALAERVDLAVGYEKRLSSIFGRFFAKETMLRRIREEEELSREELSEARQKLQNLDAELKSLRAELSELESVQRGIERGQASGDAPLTGEYIPAGEPDRSENLKDLGTQEDIKFGELLDAIEDSRRQYAEALAIGAGNVAEKRRVYDAALRDFKAEKLEWVKEREITDEERRHRSDEVMMFFYEEALRLSDAQTEENAKKPGVWGGMNRMIEWAGRQWNRIPRNVKIPLAVALVGVSAAVPPVGAVAIAVKRVFASAGAILALDDMITGKLEKSKAKERANEKDRRAQSLDESFRLSQKLESGVVGDKGVVVAFQLESFLKKDIETLDERVKKMRRKTFLWKFGARTAVIALGALASHGSGLFGAPSATGTVDAVSEPDADAARATVQVPSPEPPAELPSEVAASQQEAEVKAAKDYLSASESEKADIREATGMSDEELQKRNIFTRLGTVHAPEPDIVEEVPGSAENSGDGTAAAFSERLAGKGNTLTVETGGSIEGTIRKQLELSGVSHEESGKMAHTMLREYAREAGKPLSAFDRVDAGLKVTFGESPADGHTFPKIASIEGELLRGPVMSVDDLAFHADVNGSIPYESVEPMGSGMEETLSGDAIAAPVSSEAPEMGSETVASQDASSVGAQELAVDTGIAEKLRESVEDMYRSLDQPTKVECDRVRNAFLDRISGEGMALSSEEISSVDIRQISVSRGVHPEQFERFLEFQNEASKAFSLERPVGHPIGSYYAGETVGEYTKRISLLLLNAKEQGVRMTFPGSGSFSRIAESVFQK